MHIVQFAYGIIRKPLVHSLLGSETNINGSWEPAASNVFADSELLRPYGAQMFPMLVVDLLHEFELGVWKAVFTHLIRVLYAHSAEAVAEFAARFRLVPTFGTDTIRPVTSNASERKNLLLETMKIYFSIVMTMLFRLAEWHALAKRRMHTDNSLLYFDKSTTVIGKELHGFRDYTKTNFVTKELPGETATRTHTSSMPSVIIPPPYASLVQLIRFGELAHRLVKLFHRRTNKNNALKQVTKLERREKRSRKARAAAHSPRRRHAHQVAFSEKDSSRAADPAKKNFIPKLKNHLLGRLLQREFDGDEEEFPDDDRTTIRILGQHIYSAKLLRINDTTYDMCCDQDSINPRTHSDVMISPETGAPLLRFFTPGINPFQFRPTDGVSMGAVVWGRAQLPIQTVLQLRVLIRVPTEAKALRTIKAILRSCIRFLVTVLCEELHVEAFLGHNSRTTLVSIAFDAPTCKAARLPKIGFVSEEDPNAFGFLDPALVLRGCHLVPAFAGGRTSQLLKTVSSTAARPLGKTDDGKLLCYDSRSESCQSQCQLLTNPLMGTMTSWSDLEDDSDSESQEGDSHLEDDGEGSDGAYDDVDVAGEDDTGFAEM
ncbi:hypothetical protein B0H12DRAFT_1074570 [Mycena haematopus]|nr:hypothetical protein B0H12DRAFT_1074570 [Mycena haematopus]